jgi:multidrug resistance efflux pump
MLVAGAAIIAVSIFSGCGKNQAALSTANVEAKSVETATVGNRTLNLVAELSGTLEATELTTVSFEVGGRITHLDREQGSDVRQGDLLGQLDDSDYRLGVTRADSGVAQADASLDKLNSGARSQEIDQARAAVQKAKLNAANAHDELGRMTALFDSGAISKDTLDNTQLRAQVADQDLRSAQNSLSLLLAGARKEDQAQAAAVLAQSQVQKEQAELSLAKTKLVSPVSGTVITKLSNEGQLINAGTPVYQIGNVKQLKAVLPVPDQNISAWHIGDKVSLNVYGTTRTGIVHQISPSTNAGTGTIGVEVLVDNADKKWFVGQVVKAVHQTNKLTGLFVPVGAVISTGAQNPFVFLVKNHKAVKQMVSIGRLINNQIEITLGLKQGDVVVTKGADRLFDGDTLLVGTGGNTSD